MKKVFAIVIALLPLITMGQTTVCIGQFHGTDVCVVMKKNSNKPDYVRIPINTSDAKDACFHVKMGDVSKLRGNIFEARMKFKEWVKVADENNVADFSKDMPTKFPWLDLYFLLGDWHFTQAKIKLTFYKKDGRCYARYADGVHKFGNQYITAYVTYTFEGEDDFTEWLDVLSHDNIQAKLAESTNYNMDTKTNEVNYDKLFN